MNSIANAELASQVGEQIEYLRLDGDVERGRGFVGDQQLRTVHDGHGDHDALALSAGHLVRIVACTAFVVGDSDIAKASSARCHASARDRPFTVGCMCEHGFGNLIADAHHRIQSGHRLLEDHRDALAAYMLHLASGQRKQTRVRRRESRRARCLRNQQIA